MKPYSISSFDATQQHQYQCTGMKNWANLGKLYTITRKMSQNSSGQWIITVSKTDIPITSSFVLPIQ